MEEKKSFWKGALCGALAILCITILVLVLGVVYLFFGSNKVINLKTEVKIEAIRKMIEERFLYSDEVDYDVLRESVIKGYVDGLGDPYSVYYDEAETKSLLETTTGEFSGIGIVITQNLETGLITIPTVYENSPGAKAGLKDGDILYKVDGEDVTELDLDQIVTRIRGEIGTEVELTILRGDNREEHTFKAIRDVIEVNTVSYEMKEENIGYIYVSGFEKVTTHQFEEALNALQTLGMEALVIDLRDNPGGNLSTVCEMADIILSEGLVVYTEDKYGNREVYESDKEHQLNIPLAVLVNGNSASASEIFAGAIQDYGVGTIVGTTTYGKGIVQNLYQLTDGTCLKITTSEYFTPNGRNIHGIGIEPDIIVEYKYDVINPEADNQLEAALNYLK